MTSTRPQLIVALAIVAGSGLPCQAVAQAPMPSIGTPARLVVPATGQVVLTGRLEWLAGDVVTIVTAAGDTTRTALSETLRLQIPVGMIRKTWEGAAVGLVVGAVAGAIIAGASHHDDCRAGGPFLGGPSQVCSTREGATAAGGFLGGGLGFALGALVGMTFEQPIWGLMDRPGIRPQVTRPAAGGIGIGMTLSF